MAILNGFVYDIPEGGTIGQILVKNSNIDYDTKWIDMPTSSSGGGVPLGAIIIWSGSEDDIPTGWALCDGQDGRLDLRHKFVLGAGPNHPVGETGGSEEVTLTVDQMPVHQHELTGFPNKITSASYSSSLTPISVKNGSTAKETSSVGSSQPHPNMPPYYALCYIVKIAPDETDGVTMDQVNDAIDIAINGAIEGAY